MPASPAAPDLKAPAGARPVPAPRSPREPAPGTPYLSGPRPPVRPPAAPGGPRSSSPGARRCTGQGLRRCCATPPGAAAPPGPSAAAAACPSSSLPPSRRRYPAPYPGPQRRRGQRTAAGPPVLLACQRLIQLAQAGQQVSADVLLVVLDPGHQVPEPGQLLVRCLAYLPVGMHRSSSPSHPAAGPLACGGPPAGSR